MEQALELARGGIGKVSPNPCVGAVIVKNGNVISTGFHAKYGGPHAEVVAIDGVDCKGADLYVTLEPCCHFGKTPPCTDLIIKSGIARVFCGISDPFSKVDGGGVKALVDAGIETFVVDDKDVRKFYQPYIKGILFGLPYVTLKAGLSLDGKIALKNGESKWITSSLAREDARTERGLCDAVIVGSGTVLADNCTLSSPSGSSILRVIIDRRLSLDPHFNVFRDSNVFVATTKMANNTRLNIFKDAGVDYDFFGDDSVDLVLLLKRLFERGVRNIFVEGGSKVHAHFLAALSRGEKVVDKILFYYAPVFLGEDGIGVADFSGPSKLADAIRFSEVQSSIIGGDIKTEVFLELL